MRNLILRLNSVYPIDDVTSELLKNVPSKIIREGDYMAREGQVCRFLYYIEKGIVKHFSITPKGDKTHRILWENDIVTVNDSFFEQLPSKENIVPLEDTLVYYISGQQYQDIFRRSEAFKIISDRVKTDYYSRIADHQRHIDNLSHEEIIEYFLKTHPELFKRVDAESLASYLGMSEKVFRKIIKKFF